MRAGYRDVDLALSREFKLNERFGLMFRAEGTNAFNLVSLSGPATQTVRTSTVGQIRTAQPMRRRQVGLRLTF